MFYTHNVVSRKSKDAQAKSSDTIKFKKIMSILCLWHCSGSGSIKSGFGAGIFVESGWKSPYPLVQALAVLWIRNDLVQKPGPVFQVIAYPSPHPIKPI